MLIEIRGFASKEKLESSGNSVHIGWADTTPVLHEIAKHARPNPDYPVLGYFTEDGERLNTYEIAFRRLLATQQKLVIPG
ncbi:hypothetical protein A2382_04745 [Candidatus Woesebacteria bacterium RIFOXYB1_FULL_38_16]|uniref:Uncharacterized protein n=1 Tax=Candidatus Woesebacteria bacterium RIFOXYB1_FULL_38_16 TaxID=1802538 RepID=A0A1F8CUG8_9BACT|nr:MAG: hypothetical protein A2191_00420 [Candidatus Woesebacteria bacterium RIFOXYA1_FULL_38_9]OGM79967.1 MAG: hypothetical protein A2382_04745 [Candidatus Woesebacteria bacterium RIFOXYB1_FULL_38_16]